MPSVGTRGSGKIARGKNYTNAKSLDPRFNRGNGGYNNGYGIVTRKMFIAKRRNSLLRHDLRGPASRYRATRSSFRCNQILRTLCLLIASNLVTIIRLLPYLHSSRTCLALSTVTPSNEMFITKWELLLRFLIGEFQMHGICDNGAKRAQRKFSTHHYY